MLVLGLDLETTGLKIGFDRIIEVGCAVYDSETKTTIENYSSLVWDPCYPTPTEEALATNKISVESLKNFGKQPKEVFKKVLAMMDSVDAVVAHNGNSFDKPFFEFEITQAGLIPRDKIWVDSRYDIDYPKSCTSRRLTHLAIDHGITVHKAHRALCDIELMLDILSNYNFDKIYEKAKTPLIRIEANCPYEDRELAKKLRYNWDSSRQKWWKMIRESDFEEEQKSARFEIKKVSNGTFEVK